MPGIPRSTNVASGSTAKRPRVVIVGAGMVGARCAEELRVNAGAEALEIAVLGAEDHLPYNRVLLSSALTGRLHPLETELRSGEGWKGDSIDVRISTTVESVEPGLRLVHAIGSTGPFALSYDYLVLATGARSFVHPELLSGGKRAHNVE